MWRAVARRCGALRACVRMRVRVEARVGAGVEVEGCLSVEFNCETRAGTA